MSKKEYDLELNRAETLEKSKRLLVLTMQEFGYVFFDEKRVSHLCYKDLINLGNLINYYLTEVCDWIRVEKCDE
jgi:hypothetical protein